MIMFFVHFVLCLWALRQLGVEATPVIMLEDIVLTTIDEAYFDKAKTEVYIEENDDGVLAVNTNLALIQALPGEVEGHFKLLGETMGKYKVHTGIDMQMPLCDLLNEPIVFGPFLAVLGFKDGECPPGAGTYAQKGYTVPVDNFPDDFPENKYLGVFELLLDGKKLIAGDIYIDMQNSA